MLKLDLHGLWGRLELQDFCDNMTSVFSCDQLGLAEFSVFTVYVTNICSKTCLCTWVIVPIFWSSTFTCPIFAIEEKEFAFSWHFWLGSLTCSTIENGMSRKSSTRIIWKCEMTLNSTFVTFPTCKTTFVLHNSLMYEWSENWHKMQLHIVLKPGQKLKDFLEVLSIIFS